MKRILATLGIGGTLVLGGITLTTPDTPSAQPALSQRVSIETHKVPGGQFNFGDVPEYTLDVSETGVMSISTEGKTFSLEPAETKLEGKVKDTKSPLIAVSPKTEGVLIDKAWGNGTQIELTSDEKKLSKVVKLGQTYAANPKGEYLEISFTLGGDFIVPDGIYTERVEIAENVWLEKGKAWDSSLGDEANDISNQNYTDVQIEIVNGVLIKRIPIEWFKNTIFPVYTDAVFTFGTKELLDSSVRNRVVTYKTNTDSYVTCWSDNTDATTEGRCSASTVSGTDITTGSTVDFVSDMVINRFGGCAAGNDRWVVAYTEDLAEDRLYIRVASSTGTTINGFGTAQLATTSTSTIPTCAYVSTDTIIVASGYQGNHFDVLACTINANYTVTCGTTKRFFVSGANERINPSCGIVDTNRFICYHDINGSLPYLALGSVSGTSITAIATTTNFTTGNSVANGNNLIAENNTFSLLWRNTSTNRIHLMVGTTSASGIGIGSTTTVLTATTTNSTEVFSLITKSSNEALAFMQYGATDAVDTRLVVIPITLNFSTKTFSTSTAEQVDVTTDPGSLHAAKIGDCKFAFVWEDDNDTNDLFGIIGDTTGCETFPPNVFIKDGMVFIKDAKLFLKD